MSTQKPESRTRRASLLGTASSKMRKILKGLKESELEKWKNQIFQRRLSLNMVLVCKY